MEIVALNDSANVKSVAEDFVANIDWHQWVCVAPDKAWIGAKENMVMYVIGDDMTVEETAEGAKNAGWTEMKSATRCIESGMDPQVLKTILGHATLSMTMDLYSHVLPDTKAEQMEKVAEAF